MKQYFAASAALFAGAGMAGAVGLDRSNQDITVLFETGNYLQLGYTLTMPDVTGTDLLGNDPGNVAGDFTTGNAALKMDVTESLSFAVILDQPFGADVAYGGDPTMTLLGGTAAELNSRAVTALARYRINDAFSVHGGIRHQRLDGDITLSGLAYGGLSGYNVDLENGEGTGFVVGAAYERPDIALRVALSYSSEIEIDFDATETVVVAPGSVVVVDGTTTVSSPEAWNLDFQTGVAPGTLVFGSVRHAQYTQTSLSPDQFSAITGGASITDLDDGTAYSIGVGREITDQIAGTVSVGFEPEGEDDLVSPLAPTNGNRWIQLGGRYEMDSLVLGAGVRYTWLGDAMPAPVMASAEFEDNSAVSVGITVGYRF